MPAVLLVGGAPRVAVDALRYLCVQATGTTAVHLAADLAGRGCATQVLLGLDASPGTPAQRFRDRAELEGALRAWIGTNPGGVVVLSAAINDYEMAEVVLTTPQGEQRYPAGGDAKIPSGGQSLVLRLRPASKVVDQLPGWGHRGPLIAFKYQARATLLEAASALQRRVGAALVVANSLCGTLQALVDAQGVQQYPDRAALLSAVGNRIAALALVAPG